MTGYQVGELAELAGVSVRTLHHYDRIGLVVPGERTHAGYRVYSQGDLDRLQEVLVYRRLGLSLDEIGEVIDEAGAREDVLRRQRGLLHTRLGEITQALALVERAITTIEEGGEMTPKEMFDGLGEYERNEAEHGSEVRERWGESDAYAESQRRTKGYTPDQWAQAKTEGEEIESGLAALLRAGVAAEDPSAMDLAERHRQMIDRWFYPCSYEAHAGLGDMYVADPRFTAHYDEREPGLAAYVRDAIHANALGHL